MDGATEKDVLIQTPELSPTKSSRWAIIEKGSMTSSGFNIAAATLGAGMLSLPASFLHCGVAVGTLLLVLCCVATAYTIRLLTIVFEKTSYTTYEQMAGKLLGPAFSKVTAALIVTFCWGISIVYIVAMGDILEPLQSLNGWPSFLSGVWGRRLITTIYWACFMLPLSLAREINSLRYASVAGATASVFLTMAIVIHALQNENAASNVVWAKADPKMVMAFPVFFFAYCCQTNTFAIYKEMKDRSVNRMTLTAILTQVLCTCVYVTAGASGLADFGEKTEGDILKNYQPTKSVYLALAFFAISITLTMAFPMCIFPTRSAILQLMHYPDVYSTPPRIRVGVSVGLTVVSLVAGLFTPGIQVLFGVLGGVCGSTLGFIWPGLFVLRMGGWTRERVGFGNVAAAWGLVIGGIAAGVIGTITSLIDTFGG